MRVRVNSEYYFVPNLLDIAHPLTNLRNGDVVRVVNLPSAPPANTMGHCYVANPRTGEFIGMVHTNSLHTRADYIAYLRNEIAKREKHAETSTLVTTRLSDYAEKIGLRK